MSTIYRVTAKVGQADEEGQPRVEVRWAGSMAQVREHKAALAEEFGLKRSALDHSEEEADLSKAGVLAFLNEHCRRG